MAALVDAGWEPGAGATSATVLRRLLPARAAWDFGTGDNQIDLHWHLFHTSLGVRSDDDVWDAAETFVLDRETFLRPHPADLVLHACEQGAVDAGGARLVCATDIATIVSSVGGDGLVPRLAEQARRHSLVGRAREFLEFVAEVTDESELDALSSRLETTRSGLVERGIVRAARGTRDGRRPRSVVIGAPARGGAYGSRSHPARDGARAHRTRDSSAAGSPPRSTSRPAGAHASDGC